MKKDWLVYILRCSDQTLYTGISTNVERRVREHNEEKTGAKYTKARRPVVLVYYEAGFTRSEALKREVLFKKMTRIEKEKLIKD
jgi:putative endonuclease